MDRRKLYSLLSLTEKLSDNARVRVVTQKRNLGTSSVLDFRKSAVSPKDLMEQAPMPPTLKFGPYLVDLAAGEVRKNSSRLRLQEKPLRVLALLAERQGQVVTREELRQRLWPGDTFVDFETGLNTAVSKLRDALCDSAEEPRYIETIPRRGYRFVAPIEVVSANGHASAAPAATPANGVALSEINELAAEKLTDARKQIEQMRSSGALWLRGTIAVAVLLLAFTIWWLTPLPAPQITDIFRVTQTGRLDFLVRPATDGVRIFYMQRAGDHYDLMQSAPNGGEAQKIAGPLPNTLIWDVTPDGSQYLITSITRRGEPSPLWLWPATGGTPVKIGDIVSGSATFSPDGKQIVYHINQDLLIANIDGTGIRKLGTFKDTPDSPVWSPDGHAIRFTWNTPDRAPGEIWEIATDGSNLHSVLPNWESPPRQCCGTWTPDGHYFLFVVNSPPSPRIYAIREKSEWWRRSPRGPFLLASEATGSWSPLVDRDGKHVYFYGSSMQSDLETLDPATQQFSAMFHEARPIMLSVSPDGQWVSYIQMTSGNLWTSHLDGSASKQIPLQGMRGAFPRLSPDNRQIAFTGLETGKPESVFLVSADGGTPQPALAGIDGLSDPDWSPEGSRLVVDRDLQSAQAQKASSMLAIVDLKGMKITNLAGSEDMHQPRWSPDGRYIATVMGTHNELRMLDFAAQSWRTIAQGKSVSYPVWSRDSADVYYQDLLSPGEPLYRVRVADGTRIMVASFQKVLDTGISRCVFVSLTPEGSPIIAFDRSTSDIYGARLSLP
jgi:DNA-binding winged helix-turn-helix (wHTH) protein/Tol biopolymer transport system component